MPRASRATNKRGRHRVRPLLHGGGTFFTVAIGMNDLDRIRKELLDAVGAAGNREALEQVRVAALGRKGRITELMKGLGGLAADARKTAGATLNRLKDEIAAAIQAGSGRLGPAQL